MLKKLKNTATATRNFSGVAQLKYNVEIGIYLAEYKKFQVGGLLKVLY